MNKFLSFIVNLFKRPSSRNQNLTNNQFIADEEYDGWLGI